MFSANPFTHESWSNVGDSTQKIRRIADQEVYAPHVGVHPFFYAAGCRFLAGGEPKERKGRKGNSSKLQFFGTSNWFRRGLGEKTLSELQRLWKFRSASQQWIRWMWDHKIASALSRYTLDGWNARLQLLGRRSEMQQACLDPCWLIMIGPQRSTIHHEVVPHTYTWKYVGYS